MCYKSNMFILSMLIVFMGFIIGNTNANDSNENLESNTKYRSWDGNNFSAGKGFFLN